MLLAMLLHSVSALAARLPRSAPLSIVEPIFVEFPALLSWSARAVCLLVPGAPVSTMGLVWLLLSVLSHCIGPKLSLLRLFPLLCSGCWSAGLAPILLLLFSCFVACTCRRSVLFSPLAWCLSCSSSPCFVVALLAAARTYSSDSCPSPPALPTSLSLFALILCPLVWCAPSPIFVRWLLPLLGVSLPCFFAFGFEWPLYGIASPTARLGYFALACYCAFLCLCAGPRMWTCPPASCCVMCL